VKLELFIKYQIGCLDSTLSAQLLAAYIRLYLSSEEHAYAELSNLNTFMTIEANREEGGTATRAYDCNGICTHSARKWLKRIGFNFHAINNGIYFDGHSSRSIRWLI
jgi:hypothetical protein